MSVKERFPHTDETSPPSPDQHLKSEKNWTFHCCLLQIAGAHTMTVRGSITWVSRRWRRTVTRAGAGPCRRPTPPRTSRTARAGEAGAQGPSRPPRTTAATPNPPTTAPGATTASGRRRSGTTARSASAVCMDTFKLCTQFVIYFVLLQFFFAIQCPSTCCKCKWVTLYPTYQSVTNLLSKKKLLIPPMNLSMQCLQLWLEISNYLFFGVLTTELSSADVLASYKEILLTFQNF